MKRIIAILLAVLAVAPLFSCSESADIDASVTDAGESTENITSVEEEAAIDFMDMEFIDRVKYSSNLINDNIPIKDYDGREIIIHSVLSMGKEMNGDVLNDAEYYQKIEIEERYNVDIEHLTTSWNGWGQYITAINNYFLANEYFCDIMEIWNTASAMFIAKGYFNDLHGIGHIDVTKPWFFGNEMKTYSVNNHTFIATGFMNANYVMTGMSAVLFNKDMASDMQLENLYDVVRDGRWTLDYVARLCDEIYTDVNGNRLYDADDIYALNFCAGGSWMCELAILGVPQVSIGDDGKPILTMFAQPDKCQLVMDKMREIVQKQGAISVDDWNIPVFINGNALLGAYALNQMVNLRNSEMDFGVLPPWKPTEEQKEYYTSYLPYPWAIPITAPNSECSSLILASYAVQGYKKVLPSCYEIMLKKKYSTDEESGEMIDLMLGNVCADGMFLYGRDDYIYNMMNYNKTSRGYGSFWEAKKSMLEKQMNNTYNTLAELTRDN